jgi:hypothetical protein
MVDADVRYIRRAEDRRPHPGGTNRRDCRRRCRAWHASGVGDIL